MDNLVRLDAMHEIIGHTYGHEVADRFGEKFPVETTEVTYGLAWETTREAVLAGRKSLIPGFGRTDSPSRSNCQLVLAENLAS